MTVIEGKSHVSYTSNHEWELTKSYDPRASLRSIESEWIAKALIYHDGNLVAAAEALGISRAKLYRRLRDLDMEQK